ncbi:unnamed protein product [Caenorhabditis auriculariae]|uniref:Uncharacterized protein n=1 Tax=Caenorhabditis auriculariae TaxID=2777116 RepID=A0A8S1GPE9_9PELO|nr:unnamed protein product [Caenorhabditis auriculariae]
MPKRRLTIFWTSEQKVLQSSPSKPSRLCLDGRRLKLENKRRQEPTILQKMFLRPSLEFLPVSRQILGAPSLFEMSQSFRPSLDTKTALLMKR